MTSPTTRSKKLSPIFILQYVLHFFCNKAFVSALRSARCLQSVDVTLHPQPYQPATAQIRSISQRAIIVRFLFSTAFWTYITQLSQHVAFYQVIRTVSRVPT